LRNSQPRSAGSGFLDHFAQQLFGKTQDERPIVLVVHFPSHRSVRGNDIDIPMDRSPVKAPAIAPAAKFRRRTEVDGDKQVVQTRHVQDAARVPAKFQADAWRRPNRSLDRGRSIPQRESPLAIPGGNWSLGHRVLFLNFHPEEG
jgi:hypothetical protein